MSELLGYAKAMRALGNALHDRARFQLIDNSKSERAALLEEMALAHDAAADDLEAQAKATTTGRTGTDWHPLGGEPRKVGK